MLPYRRSMDMVTDAVRLSILENYRQLGQEKNAFETAYAAFLTAAESSPPTVNQADYDKILHSFGTLYGAAEHLANTIWVYCPWSFIDFQDVFSRDFEELLNLYALYINVFHELAAKFSFSGAPAPGATDHEYFRLVAAVFSDDPTRQQYADLAKLHSLPLWDSTKLSQAQEAVRHASIVIPADVEFSDPEYIECRRAFIDNERPFAIILGAGGTMAVTERGSIPDWNGLLRRLADRAAKHASWPKTRITEINQLLKSDPILAAQRCKEALGDYWDPELEEIFARPHVIPSLRDTTLYRDIGALPFRARLTTNYDSSYEWINSVSFIPHENLGKALHRWRKNQWSEKLVKLHGDIDSGAKVILTKDEYNAHYGGTNKDFLDALGRVFEEYQVLFVGFGVSDPFFTMYLSYITQVIKRDAPSGHVHYVISSQKDKDVIKNWRESYKLHNITYPSGKHEWVKYYISDLLRAWKRKINGKGKP